MRRLPLSLPLAICISLFAPLGAAAQTATSYEDAYAQIVMQMHMDMGAESTGNADVDFAVGMIPHHAGAIAMAELLLEHGTDPSLREMAQSIIASQSAEIAFLEEWIAANGQ